MSDELANKKATTVPVIYLVRGCLTTNAMIFVQACIAAVSLQAADQESRPHEFQIVIR